MSATNGPPRVAPPAGAEGARPFLPTLPIRRWLALAFGLVFFVPVFATLVILFHVMGQPQSAGDAAARQLRDDAARWSDPVWQAETRADLAADDVAFVLFVDGREIFRSAADPLADIDAEGRWSVQSVDVPGAEPPQRAEVYASAVWQAAWLVPVVALTALLATVAASAWFLGRTVTRPLAAASQAAHRIATGDLEVVLPSSRVREVAELTAALEGMSAALRTSLHHQAELEQERRLFIGAVAHDLRTPLFSLRGYLSGLAGGIADTPEKTARYIAVAQEKADALERLIADLFAYTRLEYLDQAPHREPLDLGVLLDRLVGGLGPQAEAKGIRLVCKTPPAPCIVDGDAHLLTRAIENLIDNAIRFTPSGGEVRVGCRPEADGIAFAVADTGPGIPPADLLNIFAPLYRGEQSRNRRTGGAGLGLATARRIFLAHGGDLSAANGPAGGAVFTGRLPYPVHPVPAPPSPTPTALPVPSHQTSVNDNAHDEARVPSAHAHLS